MRRRLEAVIFDMDGTLVDTEPLWQESDRAFAARYGLKFSPDESRRFVGMGGRALATLIKERLGLDIPLDRLAWEKDDAYMDHARGRIRAHPEMVKLAQAFHLQGLGLAIASGSSRRVIEFTLHEVGLEELFPLLVSADEVDSPKPSPDVYLKAARRLDVKPENCLAVEDSLPGVESALAAGMACVAVPHHYADNPELYRRAHLLFPDPREFSAEKVLEWVDLTYCACDECEFYHSGRCFDND